MGWSHKHDVIFPNTVLNSPRSSQPKVPDSHRPGNGSWVVKRSDFCSSAEELWFRDSKVHQGGNHGIFMVGESLSMIHPILTQAMSHIQTPEHSLSNSFQCLTSPARETRENFSFLILEFLILVSNPNPCGRRLDSQKMLCWLLQKFLCHIWAWFRLSCACPEQLRTGQSCEMSFFPSITSWNILLLSFLSTLNRTVNIKILCVTQDLGWKCYFSSKVPF